MEVHRNCNAPCDYTCTGSSKIWEVNLELSFIIDGASDSTTRWHNKGCQMAWPWRHTLAMDWQKNYSHTDRRNSGGVCGQVLSVECHYITMLTVKPGLEELTEGLGNSSYTLGCALPSSVENSQILSHRFFRWLWVQKKKWCGKTQLSICPQKLQHLDKYLMKPRHLDKIWNQGTELSMYE
jgi:hypothetical protein